MDDFWTTCGRLLDDFWATYDMEHPLHDACTSVNGFGQDVGACGRIVDDVWTTVRQRWTTFGRRLDDVCTTFRRCLDDMYDCGQHLDDVWTSLDNLWTTWFASHWQLMDAGLVTSGRLVTIRRAWLYLFLHIYTRIQLFVLSFIGRLWLNRRMWRDINNIPDHTICEGVMRWPQLCSNIRLLK